MKISRQMKLILALIIGLGLGLLVDNNFVFF